MNDANRYTRTIETAGFTTRLIDAGRGDAVLLLHGSGPGASAIANWHGTLPALADRRAVAFDLAGFGESRATAAAPYTVASWTAQAIEVLDELAIERCAVIGNSLGGRIAMELATRHAHRVERLILMGSGGLLLEPTPALRALREYSPSEANMRRLIEDAFLYDPSLASEELVRQRYRASAATFEQYRGMFSADRSDLVIAPERISAISAPALVVHGRDDKVIPLANGIRLAELLPDADLHVFARCGHWAQFERAPAFNALLKTFL